VSVIYQPVETVTTEKIVDWRPGISAVITTTRDLTSMSKNDCLYLTREIELVSEDIELPVEFSSRQYYFVTSPEDACTTHSHMSFCTSNRWRNDREGPWYRFYRNFMKLVSEDTKRFETSLSQEYNEAQC
jgi:hypothetical protein